MSYASPTEEFAVALEAQLGAPVPNPHLSLIESQKCISEPQLAAPLYPLRLQCQRPLPPLGIPRDTINHGDSARAPHTQFDEVRHGGA